MFKSGQVIPESGVYRAHHLNHRGTHEVTLIAGYPFPECSRCREFVEFEMLESAPHLSDKTSPVVHIIGQFIPEVA